ncbi:hypothetical protein WR25_15020 isoform B [Diploscapter pachys]|uniref:Active regulator of SIRT1 n=1 Tax=Diploscapter pachys TaxID=2018661 RepID=A0A2A2J9X1_9BILA|nr:hypothetical protein WR25_15020 isoform A [Diploscapter pachys]PAV58568.1 hypothetical protein WR25_15020 isoform B [Diploscapter pachys]
MSEKLLLQFLNACDEEDFNRKSKPVKRFDRTRKTKDEVQELLSAAAKSLVDLPPEESYLVEPKKKRRKKAEDAETMEFDMNKASKGLSLIEQARKLKPKDLANRNIKCIKYMEKRKVDKKKRKKLIAAHLQEKLKEDKKDIRKQREAITCLREPNPRKATGSVFSDKDFKRVGKAPKTLKPM